MKQAGTEVRNIVEEAAPSRVPNYRRCTVVAGDSAHVHHRFLSYSIFDRREARAKVVYRRRKPAVRHRRRCYLRPAEMERGYSAARVVTQIQTRAIVKKPEPTA